MSTTDPLLSLTSLEIFQQHSLPQIQSIQSTLSTTSLSKKEEIRNLVGSKYRDLLISADEIKSMEELSISQDRKLYDLIFGKAQILKDKNVDKFIDSRLNKVKQVSVDRVVQNSDFYIKLSKFLKISDEDELQGIKERIRDVSEYEYGIKAGLISEKFKEVEVILLNKLHKIDDIDQLEQVVKFVKERDEFDEDKFENVLYEKINELITLENLKLILTKFPYFKNSLEKDYQNSIIEELNHLDKEIVELDESQKEDKKLELYELTNDDINEYLIKIEYLSKGLHYKQYQIISKNLDITKEKLNFIKLINPTIFKSLNSRYFDILEKLKKHAEVTNNQLLIKYISHNMSLK